MLELPELVSTQYGRLGEAEAWSTLEEQVRPRRKLTPLEWGEQKRVFTKEGKESRWRSEATPWAREILWALSDECPHQRVVAPKGTQLGFTELGLIRIGQGCEAGQSSLVIEPTDGVAKKLVKTKFRPMVQTTPELRALFPGRSADTSLHFSSPSVDVMFGGSNSASNFAMASVPFVLADELDRWAAELDDEGDTISLAENRIAEYGFLGKMFVPSSPTVEDGPIWKEWLESDQRVFKCPCPVCGVKQQWVWDNMDWPGRGTPEADVSSPMLYCTDPGCGVGSTEAAWKGAWQSGEWVPTCKNPVRRDTIGYHLSTLYARTGQRTWANLAQKFEAAVKSGREAKMRVFWNTILGLPWKVSEEAMAADDLRARLEDGPDEGVCPEDCLLLTAGIDYQQTWVEAWIWGWTRDMRRWPIAKVVIERVTKDKVLRSARAIAEDLNREVLEKRWPHALGGELAVEQALHDSGDHPSLVFDVLEHLNSAKNVASKGVPGWNESSPARRPKITDVRRDGKVVAHGRKLMLVHTAMCKSELYQDLRLTRSDADGARFVHMPPWIGEPGLLEGLVAEEVRLNSRKKPYWHKVFERNEPLDCAVLARVAHWQLKAHRWAEAEWKRREVMVLAPARRPADAPSPDGGGRGGRRIRGRIG